MENTKKRRHQISAFFIRIVDVVLSAIVLILFLPLMAILALFVISDGEGSPIYIQNRLGYGRRQFRMYKIRTMVRNAETLNPQLTYPGDERVTSIGRFLRKYRIDEMPQFWNVLKGDMTIVGPRPEREYFANQIESYLPGFDKIWEVHPGLTSAGIVEYGYASNVNQMVERAKIDLDYLSHRNVMMDFKIILKTVGAILTGKGI